jgi:hypothetical protein
MREVAAGVDELVEIRGVHLRIVDGVDRPEHEIVRDDEKKVWALIGGSHWKRMGRGLVHGGEGDR